MTTAIVPAAVTPLGAATFEEALVAWLNARFAPHGPVITAETPLFVDGLLNSIRILDLIAWTERAIGRQIPDAQIRTDNFGTAARIAQRFAGEENHGGR